MRKSIAIRKFWLPKSPSDPVPRYAVEPENATAPAPRTSSNANLRTGSPVRPLKTPLVVSHVLQREAHPISTYRPQTASMTELAIRPRGTKLVQRPSAARTALTVEVPEK